MSLPSNTRLDVDNKDLELNHLEHDGTASAHVFEKPIEGNVQWLDGEGNIRLIPIPSSSPRDPLNFSSKRKTGILIACIWFSCMGLAVLTTASSLAPIFFGIYIRQGVSPDRITQLFTLPSVATGAANFLFLPLCLVIGRRPSFLISAMTLCAGCIWAAKSGSSFESHLGARLLMGFAAGATESTIPLIVTDYTFLHNRAKAFGLLSFLTSIPQAALTIAASYEAVLLSWQWFYWIFLILSAIGLVLVAAAVPETKFTRPAFSLDGAVSRVNDFGEIVPATDDEIRQQVDQMASGEDTKPASNLQIAFGFRSRITTHEWKIVPAVFWQMGKALLDPAIIWALGLTSLALSIIIMLSLTWGNVLVQAYGWSPQSVGLNSLGSIPAGIASFVCCGWGGDKLSIWLAKRNGGTHVPEHRLAALVVPAVTGIAMLLMYGYCAQFPHAVHWFAVVFSGNALSFATVSCFIVTTTYAVEVMSHNAGAGIVMVVGGKNLVSYGIASGFSAAAAGGRVYFLSKIFAGVWAAWMLLGVALYFGMPKYRQKAAQR